MKLGTIVGPNHSYKQLQNIEIYGTADLDQIGGLFLCLIYQKFKEILNYMCNCIYRIL